MLPLPSAPPHLRASPPSPTPEPGQHLNLALPSESMVAPIQPALDCSEMKIKVWLGRKEGPVPQSPAPCPQARSRVEPLPGQGLCYLHDAGSITRVPRGQAFLELGVGRGWMHLAGSFILCPQRLAVPGHCPSCTGPCLPCTVHPERLSLIHCRLTCPRVRH